MLCPFSAAKAHFINGVLQKPFTDVQLIIYLPRLSFEHALSLIQYLHFIITTGEVSPYRICFFLLHFEKLQVNFSDPHSSVLVSGFVTQWSLFSLYRFTSVYLSADLPVTSSFHVSLTGLPPSLLVV